LSVVAWSGTQWQHHRAKYPAFVKESVDENMELIKFRVEEYQLILFFEKWKFKDQHRRQLPVRSQNTGGI